MTIVGVVGDVHHGSLEEPPPPELYVNFVSNPPFAPFVAIRTATDPDALALSVRQLVRGLDPGATLSEIRSMESIRRASVGERRFTLVLVSVFGVIALGLAALGVYGVVALVAAERTAELGLRMALGAVPRQVARLVVGDALAVTSTGLAVGLLIAAAVAQLMRSQLYGIAPLDPVTFIAAPATSSSQRSWRRRCRRYGRCGWIRCARCAPADERIDMRLSAFATLMVLCSVASLTARSDTRLAVTQRALVVHCLNGAAVPADRRSWTVTGPVTLAVTMRNQPRPGMAPAGDSDPGTAVIDFTPEPGHRYEVEVRAAAATFSQRVWPKGDWTPVVRDRTTDAIVSGHYRSGPTARPVRPGRADAARPLGERRLESIDQRVEARHQGAYGGRLRQVDPGPLEQGHRVVAAAGAPAATGTDRPPAARRAGSALPTSCIRAAVDAMHVAYW